MTASQPKTLKFRKELADLILSGDKNVTWRLFDDKDLRPGDHVTLLVWETLQPFATAELISIREKRMSELSDEDFEGHEKFSSSEEMYHTYSHYSRRCVSPDTEVKIIHFRLLP